ncbi:hypothetical protein BCR35DRAFT_304540 [Leucosporidium creatinivorum]|uniref:Uncharacterized protein n=1 Tax=Leucosporidium creatinivorum TaxID=106004 RepID=A0A1Y2F765_9BASI|nr:hypothetical protein BCR35DRAFT_304540 [Leucosporidium creatinivorum]
MEPPQPLPLATALLRVTPNHPLIHLITSPLLARIAIIEATALRLPLLRRLGFSSAAIDVLALLAVGGAAARWRAQWRTMLGVLGVGEAILRTLGMLDLLERNEEQEDEEQERDRRAKEKQEMKHLLCFWLAYGLISLGQSLRATTPTSFVAPRPILQRLTPLLRRLRATLKPLATRYPSLPFLVPPSRPAPRRPKSFPQPRPLLAASLPRPPVPVAWLSSEVKYRLVKLFVLWTALRRDGWGASALWDWILGPIFSVKRSRKVENGLGKKKRRIKVVVEEELQTEEGSQSPRQDVFAESECSSSTTTSPTDSRHHSYSADHSFSSSANNSPYHHSTSSSAFPTPNVPFRLTSSSHPIRGGSQADYPPSTQGRMESPTPNRNAGYHVEDLLGALSKGSVGADESWGVSSGAWGPQI